MTPGPEEPPVWDGREGRIPYWKFKSNAEERARLAAEGDASKDDDDPYAGVYDDVPASLWRERSGEDDDYEEPLF